MSGRIRNLNAELVPLRALISKKNLTAPRNQLSLTTVGESNTGD
jgi:hypothetical protein